MDFINGYFCNYFNSNILYGDDMNDYFQSNDSLRIKNKALSKKVEEFRKANIYAKKNVENLNAKKLTVLKAVVALKLDGLLDLSVEQIAERFYADAANVTNIINTTKKTRHKIKLAKEQASRLRA